MCLALLLAATIAAPATDPASVNVCEKVPGPDVAKVLNRTLRSAKPFADKESRISRCVYVVAASAAPDAPAEGLVLWLYEAGDFAELNKVTEAKLEPVPGLGDQAVRFLDPGDKRHKLRVLRTGRYSLEATAATPASATALATLAVERLDN
jgi:hypothetical protein